MLADYLKYSRKYILDDIVRRLEACWTALTYKVSIMISGMLLELLATDTTVMSAPSCMPPAHRKNAILQHDRLICGAAGPALL